MAYGTPATPGRCRGLLHRRPPRPTADAPSSSPSCTLATTAIGGVSPLTERTDAQVHALRRALDDARTGRVPRRLRHQARRIRRSKTPSTSAAAHGVRRSRRARPRAALLGAERRRVHRTRPRAARVHGLAARFVERTGTTSRRSSTLLADARAPTRSLAPRASYRTDRGLFTAHSLPARILGLR